MAEQDLYMKKLLRKPEFFADLYNGVVFGGEQVLKPEQLSDVQGEQGIIILDGNGRKRIVTRRRDIIKKASFGVYFILAAEENQASIHYAMPVRGMMYDALDYTEQIENLRQAHRNRGDMLEGDEFLSGITREDKIVPVVSLTLYHGAKPWDGPKSLYDMMELDESVKTLKALKQVLPDYKINLVEASEIEHPELFHTSLQHVFTMLKYNSDKQKLYHYTRQHRKELQEMDDDSMLAMLSLLGEQKRLMKIWENSSSDRKEQKDMCTAIDDLIKDGIIKGKEEGESLLAALMDRLFQDGRFADAQIASSDKNARMELYKEYGLLPDECLINPDCPQSHTADVQSPPSPDRGL